MVHRRGDGGARGGCCGPQRVPGVSAVVRVLQKSPTFDFSLLRRTHSLALAGRERSVATLPS